MKASSVHSRWQAAALAGAERELAPAPGPVSTEATSGAAAEYRTASRLDPRGPARLRSPWLTTATAAIRTKLAIAALAPLPYPQSLEDPCPIERLWQDGIAMQVSGDVVPVLRRAKLLPAQALGASEALRLSPLAAVPCLPWLRRTTIGPFLGRHDTLSADKDVDGFHIHNLGSLLTLFPPCTPYGIKSLLDHMQIPIEGQNAVVVGRSTIVGKPMALMLLQKGATVTVCTLKTSDLAAYTRLADILVVAAGKPNLNTATMVKEGAAVIDVGIDWAPDGRLVGDVDFDGVLGRPATLRPCRVGSVR